MKQNLKLLFNKNNVKQTLLNSAFILVLLSCTYRFINQLQISHGYESWAISEFLINYQDGFVRRGLLGQLLFSSAQSFNIDVEWTIKIFCLICFASVCIFFVKAFLKKSYPLYVLPLCYFLGMGTFYSFWIRKDYLMILFLIFILSIYKSKLSAPLRILTINTLAIGIVLIHESFAFFTLPILFLLFFNEHRNRGFFQSIALSLICLLPIVLTFLLTLHYHGDLKTAQTIWDSWVPIANLKASELDIFSHGALSAIGWNSKWTFIEHFKINFLTNDRNVFSAIFWSLALPCVYYIITNAILIFRKNEDTFNINDKTNLSSILIFQFVCLIPFFLVLSCDLGRVFFYWIASSFTIFLLIPKNKLEQLFPTFFIQFTERINSGLSHILMPTKTTLALLMLCIGMPIEGFSFEKAIETSLAYNCLWIISYFLTSLKKIVLVFF